VVLVLGTNHRVWICMERRLGVGGIKDGFSKNKVDIMYQAS